MILTLGVLLLTSASLSSPSYCERSRKKIGLSLREFGIRDDRPQFIVFIFDATEAHIERIRKLVKGNAVSMDSSSRKALTDEALITKHYKIDKAELELGSLEAAVVNRIVVRDI